MNGEDVHSLVEFAEMIAEGKPEATLSLLQSALQSAAAKYRIPPSDVMAALMESYNRSAGRVEALGDEARARDGK